LRPAVTLQPPRLSPSNPVYCAVRSGRREITPLEPIPSAAPRRTLPTHGTPTRARGEAGTGRLTRRRPWQEPAQKSCTQLRDLSRVVDSPTLAVTRAIAHAE